MENFSMDQVFNFLTGSFAYSKEFQSMGMGLQGALIVRNGRNKDGSMNWFHALALSTIFAFGGGWFGFIWMGRPSSMITGADINVPCCIIAFLIANYTPLDIGLKLGNFFPVTLIITSAAQLFRCLGLIGFITFAFQALKDTPSPYYPIPLIGPILYGSLLGNMGAFFLKGFDGHLQGGIPFAFQNAFVMGTFFHLYSHDEDGPLGTFLRSTIQSIGDGKLQMGLDDRTFAIVVVSMVMQIVGILQLPNLLGGSWSPFTAPFALIDSMVRIPFPEPQKVDRDFSPPVIPKENGISNGVHLTNAQKKKRKKKKAA